MEIYVSVSVGSFESISSSCLERLGNPTYVAAHPDFKEFLEVVINRANMGEYSCNRWVDRWMGRCVGGWMDG